jgi:glycosyltransferase involved in cell wall biosynthesis
MDLNQTHEQKRMKLGIVTTHPIQYYAPLFRLLAQSTKLDIKVFYTWSQAEKKVYDVEFQMARSWDINLLEGYDYTFVPNVSKEPGSHHHRGILNPTLIQEIEQWGADTLLVFGWNFSSHLKVLRYFKGKIPIYFRGDSTLIDESKGISIRKIMRRIALTWVYRYIDFALYVGTANKEYYQAHGLKPDQLIYAPHAIDNERFAKDDEQQNELALAWRKNLGINQSAIVFLFAGKLNRNKNSEILIEAFKAVMTKTNKDLKLVIAGNGELENKLKANYQHDVDIRLIGFQNQSTMPVLYRMADVYILPSKSETWGLAVNEAMACKRAVVVSSTCGCASDLVQQGINGYVFKMGDVHDLAEKISLLSDKHIVNAMGRASLKKINNNSYEQIIQAIEDSLA